MKRTTNSRFKSFPRACSIWLCAIITIFLIGFSPVQAQEELVPSNQIDGYPVILDGQEIFRIKQGIPDAATAEERASIIRKRLVGVANEPGISTDMIQIQTEADSSTITINGNTLLTIRQIDLEPGQAHPVVAEKLVEILKPAVAEYRERRSIRNLIRGIVLAVVSTIALVIFLVFLQRLISRLLILIRKARLNQ